MADGAFPALVGVDLRRMRGHVMRGGVFTLAAIALSIVAGYAGAEDIAVVLVGTSVYYFLWPLLAAAMDRTEGGLEFLASVPVPAATVARARMAGIAVALLPIALHFGVAFAIAIGPALGMGPTAMSIVGFSLLVWTVAVGLSGLASGLIIRWGVDALGRWPAGVAALGLGAIVLMGDRHEQAIQSFVAGLVARTGWAVVLAGFALLVAVAGVAVGYRSTVTGLQRFTPERGRLKA